MRAHAVPALGLLAAIVLLWGCGDDEASSTSPAPAGAAAGAGGGPVYVAALGDSITAGSPLWDPEEAVRARIGPAVDERSQFEYWAHGAEPRLEFSNCGIFGERTDQIAARLDACVATAGPDGADVLIVQGGINDIAQGTSLRAAAANLRAMVEAGLSDGLDVAIADVLPWNNGHPQADADIAALNRRIAAIATDEAVPLLPFHDTLEDPREPGTMRPQWTIDGDHPSVAGYRSLAEKAVVAQLPTR